MVENDSGSYVEYTDSNSWPTDMTFNEDLSGCIDMDGNEITGALSFSDGKATVKTSSTTYCYLYFDKKVIEGSAEAMIETADSSTTSGLWASTLTNDGYRYVGTDPDNYICFGTDDTDTCTSDTDLYMYRIIGIFKDSSGDYHYKLIKKEALNTAYAWHSSDSNVDWGSSTLYTGINGSYFLNNTTYSYMQNTTWTDLIEDWTWIAVNTKGYEYYLLTRIYALNYNYNTVQTMYYHESNQTSIITGTCYYNDSTTSTCTVGTWTTPSGKIGLMYASDYALSLGGSVLSLMSNDSYSTLKTGWMYLWTTNDTSAPNTRYEWTMARWGATGDNVSYRAYNVYDDGRIGGTGSSAAITVSGNVRPVFYLTSDTVITGGTGTSSDPYIIG